jgi:hypothetical protein
MVSRGDLSLRRATRARRCRRPGRRCPPQRLSFALRLHAADEAGPLGRFCATPSGARAPGRAAPAASLADGVRLVELDDPDVQITAIEPRDDGSPGCAS